MIDQEKLATITHLEEGAHNPDGQFCIMEAVAYVMGEKWTDHPACVCPVLAAYARAINDRMPDAQRQRLLPFIPLLANTRANPDVERRRMFYLLDKCLDAEYGWVWDLAAVASFASEYLQSFADCEYAKAKASEAAGVAGLVASRIATRGNTWDAALEVLSQAINIKE